MRFLLVLLLLWSLPALAQDADEPAKAFDPPRGEAAKTYLDRVGRRVTTDARYLSKGGPVALKKASEDRSTSRSAGSWDIWRVIATLAVIAIVVLVVLALMQGRYGDLFARGPDERKVEARRIELADVGSADLTGVTLESLRAHTDPVEALRLILLQALTRAADANEIGLRRSFTARDVLSRVPDRWQLRASLDAIVRRAEVVLFGGRPFGRDDLAPVLEVAAPFFEKGRR